MKIATLLLSISLLAQQSLVAKCSESMQRDLQVNSVTKLELINAKTDVKILDLFDGQIIDIQSIAGLTAPDFNINALVSGPVSSVKFGYNAIATFRKETSAAYAFCGNSGANFYTCKELGYGTHTVRATPTSGTQNGQTLSITFTITNSSPPTTPVSPPIPVPMSIPVSAPVAVPTPVPVVVVPVAIPVAGPAITGLRLMNAGVNPSIAVMNLAFDTVNVADLLVLGLPSAQFNIDVLVASNVKSVTFSNGRVETAAPLAYCGNSGNNFFPCSDLTLGATVTVVVTAYSEQYGQGIVLGTRSTTIQIIRTTPPVAPITPTPAPIAPPVIPPVSGCLLPRIVGSWEGTYSGATVPYPIQVAEAQGAMIGNDFVITSGFKSGYSMATPETYALDMSTPGAPWRRMDDMPFPMGLTHLGVAVKGMKAYFCGGYIGGSHGIHNGSCFEYDHSIAPGSGQWTNFTSLPDGGRSGGGMIYDETLDALVYSAGSQRPRQGIRGAIDFQNTWMYSFANTTAGWVSKRDIPFHGNHMNFITAKDQFGKERHFFFGGQHGDEEETQNTDEMYEYNAITDTWTQRQSIPYPLGHAAASTRAIGCGFIVAGGRTNSGLTSAITYYDIPTNTWTKIGDLTNQIHTNVCVIANNTLLRCETGWATGTFSWKTSIAI